MSARAYLTSMTWFWMVCMNFPTFGGEAVKDYILEGQRYEMICQGNLSFQKWTVSWHYTTKTGDTKNLPTNSANECHNHYDNQYRVCYKKTSTETFISSVTIQNVSQQDRDGQFSCFALSKNNSVRQDLGNWTLSRTFSPNLTYQFSPCNFSHTEQAVRVSCVIDRVYPNISCDFFYQFHYSVEYLPGDSMSHSRNSSTPPGYYKVNCSAVFSPECGGDYTLCANLSNSINAAIFTSVCKNYTFKGQTTLRIIPPSLNVIQCSFRNKTVNFTCEVSRWPSNNRLQSLSWHNENMSTATKAIEIVPIIKCANQSYYYSTFFYKATTHKTGTQTNIFCSHPSPDAALNNLSSSAIINVHPNEAPQLQYLQYVTKSRTEVLVQEGETINVTCSSRREFLQGKLVLECLQQDNASRVIQTNNSHEVSLTIRFERNTTCSCRFHDVTDCTSPASTIMFLSTRGSDSIMVKLLIGAASVVFTIVLVICTVLCIKTKITNKPDAIQPYREMELVKWMSCKICPCRKGGYRRNSKTCHGKLDKCSPYAEVKIIGEQPFALMGSCNFSSGYSNVAKIKDKEIPVRIGKQNSEQSPACQASSSSMYTNSAVVPFQQQDPSFACTYSQDLNLHQKELRQVPQKAERHLPPLPPREKLSSESGGTHVYAKINKQNLNTSRHDPKLLATTSKFDPHQHPPCEIAEPRLPPRPCRHRHKTNEDHILFPSDHLVNPVSFDRILDLDLVHDAIKTDRWLVPAQRCPPPPMRARKMKPSHAKSCRCRNCGHNCFADSGSKKISAANRTDDLTELKIECQDNSCDSSSNSDSSSCESLSTVIGREDQVTNTLYQFSNSNTSLF